MNTGGIGNRWSGSCFRLLLCLACCAVQAEVVVHGSATQLPGPNIEVAGDLGEIRGTNEANLLHTFSVFNILSNRGESVTFTPPSNPGVTVRNVISRVTGGTSAITGETLSRIDGPLISAIPGANFFFFNPHGIVFGPNAELQVDGAFYASTADALHFNDGGVVFADPSASSVLSAAPPSAFGFLETAPASIRVEGNPGTIAAPAPEGLTFVAPGDASLSLLGGDIEIPSAGVRASGHRLNLVSVAAAGQVLVDDTGIDMASVESIETLGQINLTGETLVDGQEVFIRSGRLVIEDSLISPGGFALLFDPTTGARLGSAVNGGQINIKVRNDINISGQQPLFGSSINSGTATFNLFRGLGQSNTVPSTEVEADSIFLTGAASIRSSRDGPGDPGEITVNATTLEVRDGASINSINRFGFGIPDPSDKGADIVVSADNILLSGDGGVTFTGLATQSTDARGFIVTNAGSLEINAGNLEVRNGAEISSDSFAFGNGGDVTIVADHIDLSREGASEGGISSDSRIAGNPGNITITTRTLELRDGFQISATTAGVGDAGSVTINASESILISGLDSGIFSEAFDVRTVDLDRWAMSVFGVDFQTFLDFAGLTGLDQLLGFFAIAPDPGNGGSISVSTPSLLMDGDTRIDSSTFGNGIAGSVTLDVGTLDLSNGARVESRSGGIARDTQIPEVGTGDGGRVTINATDTVRISGSSPFSETRVSRISTATLGEGRGGDIEITAGSIELSDQAVISASSAATGDAGDISIFGTDAFTLNNGFVTTQALQSDGGSIDINIGFILHLVDSEITTSVESGIGNGGNINIDPVFVILESSRIQANAFGGSGGNINIVADQFFISPDSSITASSQLAADGTVVIDAPDQDIISAIASLPGSFFDATALLSDPCSAQANVESSNFFVTQGEGLSPSPDGYLPSFAVSRFSSQAMKNTDNPNIRRAFFGAESIGPSKTVAFGCGRK